MCTNRLGSIEFDRFLVRFRSISLAIPGVYRTRSRELNMTLYKSTSNVTGLDTPLQTNGIKFIEAVSSSKACTAKCIKLKLTSNKRGGSCGKRVWKLMEASAMQMITFSSLSNFSHDRSKTFAFVQTSRFRTD